MLNKYLLLSGWGNFPSIKTNLARPERINIISQFLNNNHTSFIPRGAGKSYGDAALNQNTVLTTERLNHFIAFDKNTGIIKCQAGVTLHDVLEVVTPHGWFLPVLPGTQWATVGGSFACNVHGKNHRLQGDFAEQVRSILLLLPHGERLLCTPTLHSEIFYATAGGMGMTGLILELELQLVHRAPWLKVKRIPINSMTDLASTLSKNTAEHWVAWIDHFGTGNQLGRGIVESANHCSIESEKKIITPQLQMSVPKFWPKGLLNPWSMRFYNYFRLHYAAQKTEEIVPWSSFFNPLDHLQNWNRLYGKPGFLQYQCLIPEHSNMFDHLAELLVLAQKKDIFSYLVVVKAHRDSKGLMRFSKKGISVAMDFSYHTRILDLLNTYDSLITQWNGRIYLAKDARLSARTFESMYADALPAWRAILQKIDPDFRLESLMSHRLGFKI